MLPMLIKRDDVSSETNANARHSRLRAYRSQYLYELVDAFVT